MQVKDVAVVQAYHRDRMQRFGSDSTEALGWKNSASQQHRFQHFADFGDLAGKEVLDVGCGHADIYPYLKQLHGDFSYTGIDQVAAFLEVAVQRFGAEPNTRFLLGEFGSLLLPAADYVICCGALNYRNSDPAYLFKMINRLFDACRVGVGLSLLKRVDFEQGILVPSDPAEVVKFGEQLAASVVLRDAPESDYFSVFLYR
ncbi:MAG: class I SAM-dependent methyltransferase [Pseudomonadales bacterium]|nr:class I SAM-dependent methyltransferase [Pseudomonadales bacterium]